MEKKQYEGLKLEVITIEEKDVITVSGPSGPWGPCKKDYCPSYKSECCCDGMYECAYGW